MHADEPGRGRVEDPDGRLTRAERRTADLLASEGRTVIAAPRATGYREKSADLFIDGVPTEIKNLQSATNLAVRNAWKRGQQQARQLVIDARDTDLHKAEASRGMARGAGAYSRFYDRVRLIGPGFERAWEGRPDVSLRERPH